MVTLFNHFERLHSIPSQAEAEAGTATTARAWTAERVRQAIASLANDAPVDYAKRSYQMFDASTVTEDTQVVASGATASNASYDATDFIMVEPGVSYYVSGVSPRFHACYDEDKVVSPSDGSDSALAQGVWVAPAGIYWVRFTVSNSALFMLTKGTDAKTYAAYGDTEGPISTLSLEMATYGDSITYQNKWQPTIYNALGATHTNLGVNGRRIMNTGGMADQTSIDTIPTDTELLIIMGGTNDWAVNKVMGDSSSTGLDYFYSAVSLMLERVQLRCPNATIIINTPPYAERTDWVAAGFTDKSVNGAGYTINDYAATIREVAAKYNIPVADVSANCGWNSNNIEQYMGTAADHLHPSQFGADRMGRIVLAKILQL